MKFVILFNFLLLPILLFPYFYKVESIVCISQYGACSKSIVAETKQFENKPIKEILIELGKFLSNHPRVDSFNITYRPVANITIDIMESKAEIAIKENNSPEFLLVSKNSEIVT